MIQVQKLNQSQNTIKKTKNNKPNNVETKVFTLDKKPNFSLFRKWIKEKSQQS